MKSSELSGITGFTGEGEINQTTATSCHVRCLVDQVIGRVEYITAHWKAVTSGTVYHTAV